MEMNSTDPSRIGHRSVFESNTPLFMPSIPTMRMTRRLKGATELEESDDKRYFDDAVGMTGDWRKRGPIRFIPFSCLAAVRTGNLVTAGRCVSANTAWDITRVIPTCAVTGEVAGTAAAMVATTKTSSFDELDIQELQRTLVDKGVFIDQKFARG